ncbi:MAG TPA: single-stranded-DNA-specific exonuclease RecJ [Bacteroidales bacterium]|nr:single-stranded-DNA-specific exonuclease RecJ [Bacteroidales bacterium]HPS49853.1 single-stranded-DNA-specific exonuclease RecJ [Bacteroidales bacterium]
MDKSWVLKPQGDSAITKELSQCLGIGVSLTNLLVQRGITTFEGAKTFFRPSLSDLHDPFLMKDMDKAIARIAEAITNHEKILVYGDYDVDGTSAVALVYTFLQSFYTEIDFYIPDRYDEGYGISVKGIDFAYDAGFKLVIALDCGIKAVEKVAYAKSKGIDFIICDHHRPGADLPPASAILDPKRADCSYPYKELSGCGIGFKLVQAYAQFFGIDFEKLIQYLDLVVIAIASDIVDITGENRVLAYFGLKLINTKPRPGLEALLRYSSVLKNDDGSGRYVFNRELTITDLVFMIGPRINAAGRIESGKNSVRLLITQDPGEANLLAEQINAYNTERKTLDSLATQQAMAMIEGDEKLRNARSTVIYHPEWHKGVIGIVASRLTENFYRPTVVLTLSNGLITGSARSVRDFDIYEAVDACSDLLEHFGGHKFAAGLSLQPGNLEAFCTRFEATVSSRLEGIELVPVLEIDAPLSLSEINSRFYGTLKQFAPFGPGNMAPVFMTRGVMDAGGSRIVGKNHLKLSVVHPEIAGGPFSAIAFQQGEHFGLIEKQIPFNICYHVEENEWNGSVNLQLNIKDIKFFD